MEALRVARNEPCPCGSGKKFKRCCLPRQANGVPPLNGIVAPPQRSTRLQDLTGPPPPTFASRPPGRPDAPPPPGGERVKYVFVRGKGWLHMSELQPGGQYQLKEGGWKTYRAENIEATGNQPFWVESGEDLGQRPVPVCCRASGLLERSASRELTPIMSSVEERVKEVTARVLNLDPSDIRAEQSFTADLGAESVQSIELVAMFEEEFGIEMDEDAALAVQTVGDAVRFITRVCHEQGVEV